MKDLFKKAVKEFFRPITVLLIWMGFIDEPWPTGYIYVRRSSDKKYYFVISGRNNKVVVTSETYETKQACMKGIETVRTIVRGAYSVKDFAF